MIRCLTEGCRKLVIAPQFGGTENATTTMTSAVRCGYCGAEYLVSVTQVHKGVVPIDAKRSTD